MMWICLFFAAGCCFALVALFAEPARPAAQPTHPFTVHDLWAMERISSPSVSPDGGSIAFEKKVYNIEENKGVSDLWLVGIDGAGLRRLTTHKAGSNSPVWAPDGRSILFLSSRSGSTQVWRLPVDGGEAEKVTDEPLEVGNLVISRDGQHIAFTMEVFPGSSPKETKERLDAKSKQKATGRVFDKLFIRHWDTWKDGRRSHVFVRPTAGGQTTDVMSVMDADSPTKPFGGAEEIAFSPDGNAVLFCARDVGPREAWSTQVDLYLAPIDGSSPPRRITRDNQALTTQPVFSPDGRTLAYRAMKQPGYESDRFRIVLQSWPDGVPRVLTEEWDRSPLGMVWSTDGGTIYAVADNLGQRSLFSIDAATGGAAVVVRDGKITDPQVAGGRIIFGYCHHQSPVELHSADPTGGDIKRVTNINATHLASVRMGEPEQFTFQGDNDEEVYAYVLRPVDFDASKKYPVAFLVHGGPQSSFGSDFHYRWNPQVYAGAGYAAVMIDFHGSTGYGQKFTESISGDWAGAPFVDLQKGLDAALKRYPWMDGDRVAALGASFGGYMINWIAGNWPDRFRCLVNHDGNLCERMAYYDTEELWFPEWDHRGTPWDNREGYEKYNPVDHVGKWKTPMLVIHGGRDFRVVETQGMATFTALQRRGIPSKFLYFPDENHWVLKPANSIQWHETVLAWLDQWTKV